VAHPVQGRESDRLVVFAAGCHPPILSAEQDLLTFKTRVDRDVVHALKITKANLKDDR
jgi:hypothetical protein